MEKPIECFKFKTKTLEGYTAHFYVVVYKEACVIRKTLISKELEKGHIRKWFGYYIHEQIMSYKNDTLIQMSNHIYEILLKDK